MIFNVSKIIFCICGRFIKKKPQLPIPLTFYALKKSCSGKGFIVPRGKQKIRILILLKTNVVALL